MFEEHLSWGAKPSSLELRGFWLTDEVCECAHTALDPASGRAHPRRAVCEPKGVSGGERAPRQRRSKSSRRLSRALRRRGRAHCEHCTVGDSGGPECPRGEPRPAVGSADGGIAASRPDRRQRWSPPEDIGAAGNRFGVRDRPQESVDNHSAPSSTIRQPESNGQNMTLKEVRRFPVWPRMSARARLMKFD